MKNQKISIIIVSLNTKVDFLKTLKSIKKQTYKNYEIVIVDGVSNDGTIKEIKKLKKKNIKYIIEKDKGIYDAMNKGIKISKGKWLIFMNSGDNFINKNILKKISKKKIGKSDILFGDTIIQNNFFNYNSEAKNFTKGTLLMPFCHQSTLVKRNLLTKFPFDLNYKFSSDFNFFINCYYKNYSFLNLNLKISKVTSGGFSDLNRKKVFKENINIIKKYNHNVKYFTILYVYIWYDFFKNVIKFLLPDNLNAFVLSIKYGKRNSLK